MVKRTHFSSVTGDFVPDDFMPADGDLVKQKDYDKAIKQRDQLREALERIEHATACSNAGKAHRIARAALKATEEG